MKTSVAILLTIISMAAATPLFFGPKHHEHHVIHVPYHVHKVPVYIKEPVYIQKPVYIYKTVDHHDHHYHHDDHYDHHDDHYDSHWY
ncbi:uncharacterized protein DDB_G0272718-like [Rhopalosiphum padi]|uniref:uncharacterized protein DDB_G0272718-like n=1 Tax=Rhopalosiphum padi TaxID=40932 RepID=UPI00298DBF5E|nr:uncharacterized protein DDB_G0272718-like [Rhopalosiphum padi]